MFWDQTSAYIIWLCRSWMESFKQIKSTNDSLRGNGWKTTYQQWFILMDIGSYWAPAQMISHTHDKIFLNKDKLGHHTFQYQKIEHDKQKSFFRGQEKDPVCCSVTQRKWETRTNTTNGNASQEKYKNTPFVMLACKENGRHIRSWRTGIIIESTIRRPCSMCSNADRTRGARKHYKQELFLYYR